ncbi:unnamed protein product [Eruca vesicaria subsp. sativa]|uniref:Uncharacterized protein n=1 Tax=Eruca vesicaria subsp. sativa TaxID=29727 RepID=A0ABC8L5M2_ERUVS|nr:unnamed protein product [Eruca vesicaria subsp. sativa]
MATPSPLPPPPTVNLWVILSESKRIINAHSRHFLALSLLFLLPISFSITVYPSISRLIINQYSPSHTTISLLRTLSPKDQPPNSDDIDPTTILLLLIAYIVFVTVFNLLSIGSITYSIFQGFYGRPVKLISAVKSSFTSLFPLIATLTSANSIVFAILLILGLVAFLLTRVIVLIVPDLEVDYASTYFQALSAVVTLIFIAIVIKLYVNWILAWVIVVVESSYGFTPLKRSKSLVNGMESVSLSMIVVFSIAQSCLVLISNITAYDIEDGGKIWTNAVFVFQIVVTSALLTGLMLYNLAGTTVMYMYCKAFQGELAWEIAEEFAREYVSLPFDYDGKGPHVVSVAYNG